MKEKQTIIIDCDPGIDDAMALMMAFCEKSFNIKLISSVFGNIGNRLCTKNALRMLDLLRTYIKKDRKEFILVANGSDTPIDEKALKIDARFAHGESGLGEFNFEINNYDENDIEKFVINEPIVEIYRKIFAGGIYGFGEKEITIICLSPLTNIAKFIKEYPSLAKSKIKQIIFMGGSIEDITYNEFNISIDPLSAEIVLNSELDIVMVPMEMGHTAFLTEENVEEIKRSGKMGEIVYRMLKKYNDTHVQQPQIATHDPAVIAYLTHPELFKTNKAEVLVMRNEDGGATTYCNFKSFKPNATVLTYIDVDKFRKLFLKSIKNYN